MAIKLEANQEITFINAENEREKAQVFNPKVDTDGFISLMRNGKIIKVHQKRIVEGDQNMSTTTAPVAVPVKPKAAPAVKVKPPVQKVDFADLAKSGEVWIKGGVEFDDGKTDVKTVCMLFPDKKRYLSFNIYNGTYGKKGKTPPIQQILEGQAVGYEIKDLAKLHDKLKKESYTQFGS